MVSEHLLCSQSTRLVMCHSHDLRHRQALVLLSLRGRGRPRVGDCHPDDILHYLCAYENGGHSHAINIACKRSALWIGLEI